MAQETRPGGRSARVAAAVLDATIEELGAVGYHALSVDSVAHRAGVHKTTVYRRWTTKDRLIVEALERAAEQRVDVPDRGDLAADLRALARSIRTTLRSDAGDATVRALVAAGPDTDGAQNVYRRFWEARMHATRPIIERALTRGELPAGTDADQVLMAVAAPLHHRLLVTGQPLTEAAADTAAAAALAAARAGVFVAASRRPR